MCIYPGCVMSSGSSQRSRRVGRSRALLALRPSREVHRRQHRPTSMLTELIARRTAKSSSVPCQADASGPQMRTEVFENGQIEINNAVSAGGRRRSFCTWAEGFGVVGGDSLLYPWISLKTSVVLGDPDYEFSVVKTHGSIEISGRVLASPLIVGSRGLHNAVQVRRGNGELLAEFPAMRRRVMLDVSSLSEAERVAILAVIGSGLVRRRGEAASSRRRCWRRASDRAQDLVTVERSPACRQPPKRGKRHELAGRQPPQDPLNPFPHHRCNRVRAIRGVVRATVVDRSRASRIAAVGCGVEGSWSLGDPQSRARGRVRDRRGGLGAA